MKRDEKDIIRYFEEHARGPDFAPYLIQREQLVVLKAIQKDLSSIKQYLAEKGITDTSS